MDKAINFLLKMSSVMLLIALMLLTKKKELYFRPWSLRFLQELGQNNIELLTTILSNFNDMVLCVSQQFVSSFLSSHVVASI